jgi:hypothetical protein
MSQTKTRGMIYSSNVSDKKKGYGILLECLTEKQGLWYILRMSQTQTRGMMYSSNFSHTNKVMIYSLKFYEKHKVDDIFLECLTQKQGL